MRTAYSFVGNRHSEVLAPEGAGEVKTSSWNNTSTSWRTCALQEPETRFRLGPPPEPCRKHASNLHFI